MPFHRHILMKRHECLVGMLLKDERLGSKKGRKKKSRNFDESVLTLMEEILQSSFRTYEIIVDMKDSHQELWHQCHKIHKIVFSFSWFFDMFFPQWKAQSQAVCVLNMQPSWGSGGGTLCQRWCQSVPNLAFLTSPFCNGFSCEMKRGDREKCWKPMVSMVTKCHKWHSYILGLILATTLPFHQKNCWHQRWGWVRGVFLFGGPVQPCGFRSLALSFTESDLELIDDCSSSSMLYVTVNVWFLFSFDIFRRFHHFCSLLPFLKLTFSHLKMDGWNTIVSFWGTGLFSGAFAVSFRECNCFKIGHFEICATRPDLSVYTTAKHEGRFVSPLGVGFFFPIP